MNMGIFLVIAFIHLPSFPLALPVLLGCIFWCPLPYMWELLFLREVKELNFHVFPPCPFSNCYQGPWVFSGYRALCYSTLGEWFCSLGKIGKMGLGRVLAVASWLQASWRKLSQGFLQPFLHVRREDLGGKFCENVWNPYVCRLQGLCMFTIATFSAIVSKFLFKLIYRFICFKWNLSQVNISSSVPASFMCPFLYFTWLVCPTTSAVWRFHH